MALFAVSEKINQRAVLELTIVIMAEGGCGSGCRSKVVGMWAIYICKVGYAMSRSGRLQIVIS